MKIRTAYLCLFTCLFTLSEADEVKISQLPDCFRIEINEQLFTEWQMADCPVPYLYPVIGPNGENITRHYPMKEGVEGESQDHPHHRSIRYSHRDVNGASFWSPNKPVNNLETKVDLLKVEKMTSGETGELVMMNSWKINDKEIAQETVRLAFRPLPDREVLMDYDTTLKATSGDVTFGDNKDGGMSFRVASSMTVKNRVTKTGKGTIINSRGDTNVNAWGKRANWADYSGPGPSGKIVGIAMFDHPENLRFPVHWHARDYGLMAANRFGKGHFEKKNGAQIGDGAYTIKKGDNLKLRHQFLFHHGNAEQGKVAEHYANYIKK